MLNKVQIIGRMGQDPEVRQTQSGKTAAQISVATTMKRTVNGQPQETTEWHRVILWEQQANFTAQYLRKGSKMFVEGRIQSRKYQGTDGLEKTAYEIIAHQILSLDSAPQGQQGAPAPQAAPQQQYQRQAAPQQPQAGGIPTPNQGQQAAPQQMPVAGPYYGAPQQAAPQQQTGPYYGAPQQQGGYGDNDVPF